MIMVIHQYNLKREYLYQNVHKYCTTKTPRGVGHPPKVSD